MNDNVVIANGGVWPSSSTNEYFIFCVGQHPAQIQAFMSWATHNKIGVKPLLGSYKGQSERSFIANMKNFDRIKPFLADEETILVLSNYDRHGHPCAILQTVDGKSVERLGRLHPTSPTLAKQRDSWSYDPSQDIYFVTD